MRKDNGDGGLCVKSLEGTRSVWMGCDEVRGLA